MLSRRRARPVSSTTPIKITVVVLHCTMRSSDICLGNFVPSHHRKHTAGFMVQLNSVTVLQECTVSSASSANVKVAWSECKPHQYPRAEKC